MLLVNPNFTQRNKSVLAYATNRMQFIHSLKVIQGDLLFFIHITYNVGLSSIGALVIKLKKFYILRHQYVLGSTQSHFCPIR